MPRPLPTSVRGSTVCRWRSSSPPRACAAWGSTRSRGGSIAACPCCRQGHATRRIATGRFARRSPGVTSSFGPRKRSCSAGWECSAVAPGPGRSSGSASPMRWTIRRPGSATCSASLTSSSAIPLSRAISAAGTIRYRLLETVREFAIERLEDSGESPAIRRRHAEWCAELLESIAGPARLRPGEVRAAEPEIGNILSALEWAADAGEVDLGLRILRLGVAPVGAWAAPSRRAGVDAAVPGARAARAQRRASDPGARSPRRRRVLAGRRPGRRGGLPGTTRSRRAAEVTRAKSPTATSICTSDWESLARCRPRAPSWLRLMPATEPLGIGSGPLAASGPSPRCC